MGAVITAPLRCSIVPRRMVWLAAWVNAKPPNSVPSAMLPPPEMTRPAA